MEDELLSRRAFADVIGKSHTWVADRIKDETITLHNSKIPKNRALEQLKEFGYTNDEGKKRQSGKKFPPILQSKERYEYYRANKMEIETGLLEGRTIDRKEAFEVMEEVWKLLTFGYGECAMNSNDFIHGSKRDDFTEKFVELMGSNEKLEKAFALIQEIKQKEEL